MKNLQKEYDNLIKLENQYKDVKEKFYNNLRNSGYRLVDAKIVEDKKDRLGLYFEYNYYDTYVGERGAMYNTGDGLFVLDKYEKSILVHNNLKRDYENYINDSNKDNKENLEESIGEVLSLFCKQTRFNGWMINSMMEQVMDSEWEIDNEVNVDLESLIIKINIDCNDGEQGEFEEIYLKIKECSEYDGYIDENRWDN